MGLGPVQYYIALDLILSLGASQSIASIWTKREAFAAVKP